MKRILSAIAVVSAAMVLSVIYMAVPRGKFRAVARFTGAMVLLLAVLRPLAQIDLDWDLSYSDSASQIQSQIDVYREESLEKTENIIIAQTTAYISDKGRALGLDCHPVVTTRLEDGIPFPDTVTMDIPLNEELAALISADLGIERERQIWQER